MRRNLDKIFTTKRLKREFFGKTVYESSSLLD